MSAEPPYSTDVLTELDIIADWFAITQPKKGKPIAERLERLIKHLEENKEGEAQEDE